MTMAVIIMVMMMVVVVVVIPIDAPKLICSLTPLILIFRTSSLTNSSTSATQISIGYDKVDDGGSCSGDFNKKFYPRLKIIVVLFISMLRASSSIVYQLVEIAVEYDEFNGGGGKLVVKKLENCQKALKVSKI